MSIPKVLAAVGLALAASCASASVTYTFTADGVTDSNAQQGTAVFVFSDDGSQLALTLTDNVNPTSFIASELDGFTFSLSQAPTTQSLLSVSAQSVINCTGISGSTCPAGGGSSPYGYGSVLNGDEITLGAGFTGSGFSYHPYAIVNASYIAPGGQGFCPYGALRHRGGKVPGRRQRYRRGELPSDTSPGVREGTGSALR